VQICDGEIFLQGGTKGILLIHGFGKTPKELEGIAVDLNEAGFTVYCPVLPGHGTGKEGRVDPFDLFQTSPADWIADAHRKFKAFKKEVEDVFVGGLSIGAIIGLKIAEKEKVAGLLMWDTPLFYTNIVKVGVIAVKIVEMILKRKGVTSIGIYHNIPLDKFEEIQEMIKDAQKVVKKIEAPILVLHSVDDDIAHPKSARFIYRNVKSKIKELRWLKGMHGINEGETNPQISNYIISFLKKIT